ncbi:MAG: ribonuclease P [Methanomicrobiales archaeon]|nr:ribonuclease P [Methanomicrobiales archaeon]
MAVEAREAGLDSLAAAGTPSGEIHGVRIFSAAVIHEQTVKGVIAALRAMGQGSDLALVDTGDQGFNRAVISLRGVDVLRQVHRAPNGAFTHVTARMAADRGVALEFDLQPLVHHRGWPRQRVLQSHARLLRLQRRYGFLCTVATNARSMLDLRNPREMAALTRLFGMEEEETMSALATPAELARRRREVP